MKITAKGKSAILKIVIYLLALMALTIVLSTRIAWLGRFMTNFARIQGGGDLYQMSGLSYFRMQKNSVPFAKNPHRKDAQVVFLGDSFAKVSVGEGSFHTRLQKALDVPLFFDFQVRRNKLLYWSPLQLLEKRGPFDAKAKVFVWLRVERMLSGKAYMCGNLRPGPRSGNVAKGKAGETTEAGDKQDLATVVFDNSKLEYVLKNGFLTRWIFETAASGRFLIFKETSTLVPKYSLSPRMLFYYKSVNSFNQSLESKRIEDLICYFSELQAELKEECGMTLVLVPVPDKYTIYHDYEDPATSYNNFLPTLTERLEENGVICVNLYPAFMRRRDEILYWADDTHWNGKGIGIAATVTAETIQERNLLDAP